MKKIYILHGWAQDAHNIEKWEQVQSEFTSAGFETLVLKIPGLDSKLDQPWDLNDYVAWLAEKLPMEKVYLLGHSFGGQLAIRFTAKHNNRVEKLILIDSAGMIDRSLRKQLKRTIFNWIAKVGKLFTRSEALRKVLYTLAREQDYYKADPIMRKTMQNVITDEVVSDLNQVTAPTVIIWGKQDTATPISFAKIIKNGIVNAKLEIIRDARHAPQFTHTREVVRKITDFIENKSKP